MSQITFEMDELHWALQVMDTIDVGLVVLDLEHNVCLWNSFMQSYSGINGDRILHQNLFDVVPNLPQEWLKAQISACSELKSRIFSNWEDRPHIFDFKNYSPLSHQRINMYQNIVMTPLTSLNGRVSHVCLMVQDVSDVASSKLYLRDSNERLSTMSRTDGLTGLFNRAFWESCLAREFESAKLQSQASALVIFDIDHFKNINDSLGHDVGDQLLIEVSRRIKECLRSHDLICRIGGDEFILVVESSAYHEKIVSLEAASIAHKLLSALASPYFLQGSEYYITASIGISLFTTDISITELLKQSDTAMYHAKQSGRNRYSFFEMAMQKRVEDHLRVEKQLRHGIEANQLKLLYQPQINLDGICKSVEALVRWHHPEHGIISPGEFIHIAEESNLINKLGQFVFKEACRQFQQWRMSGIELDYISVNVSPRQFYQSDIVNQIQQEISAHGFSPSHIMIEITEGVILNHTEQTIAKINALKEFGIRIAVDDFGSGYSSLKYLKQLPLDQLKIDKSFVLDLPDDQDDVVIAEAIISMANHFELSVIAEGVETREQLELLLSIGCTNFQGYYFSKPLEAEVFARQFVKNSRFSQTSEVLLK